MNSWKSLEIRSNFPDLEKVWKMEIKSEKMLKSLEFFSKLRQQVLYKWIFFSFWSNLIQSCLYISCLFEASIDHLLILITLSLETVLNFGSKKLNERCCVYFMLLFFFFWQVVHYLMDPYFGWLSAGMCTGSPISCYEKEFSY